MIYHNYFINLQRTTRDRLQSSLYKHEYGHYIQSQWFGPTYLFAIGAPSLLTVNAKDNDYMYWERTANKKASSYFGRHYNVD